MTQELGGARRLREIAASGKQQIKALVSHLAQAEVVLFSPTLEFDNVRVVETLYYAGDTK